MTTGTTYCITTENLDSWDDDEEFEYYTEEEALECYRQQCERFDDVFGELSAEAEFDPHELPRVSLWKKTPIRETLCAESAPDDEESNIEKEARGIDVYYVPVEKVFG